MIPSDFNFATRNHDECSAHSDDLGSNEGEGSLRTDTPPSNKSAGGTRNIIILDEWTGIFPVAETNSETNVRVENKAEPERRNLTYHDLVHLQGQE